MANDTTISPTTETKGDNKRSLLICIQLLYFHFHNVTCIFFRVEVIVLVILVLLTVVIVQVRVQFRSQTTRQ